MANLNQFHGKTIEMSLKVDILCENRRQKSQKWRILREIWSKHGKLKVADADMMDTAEETQHTISFNGNELKEFIAKKVAKNVLPEETQYTISFNGNELKFQNKCSNSWSRKIKARRFK